MADNTPTILTHSLPRERPQPTRWGRLMRRFCALWIGSQRAARLWRRRGAPGLTAVQRQLEDRLDRDDTH